MLEARLERLGWMTAGRSSFVSGKPSKVVFFLASVELAHKFLSLSFIELVIRNGKEMVGMNAIDHLFCAGKLPVLHESSRQHPFPALVAYLVVMLLKW